MRSLEYLRHCCLKMNPEANIKSKSAEIQFIRNNNVGLTNLQVKYRCYHQQTWKLDTERPTESNLQHRRLQNRVIDQFIVSCPWNSGRHKHLHANDIAKVKHTKKLLAAQQLASMHKWAHVHAVILYHLGPA